MKNYNKCKEGFDAQAISAFNEEQSSALGRWHTCSGSHWPYLVTHVIST